jgi:hypothetical protein
MARIPSRSSKPVGIDDWLPGTGSEFAAMEPVVEVEEESPIADAGSAQRKLAPAMMDAIAADARAGRRGQP